MNKRQLVAAVGDRTGNKKAAGEAVEALIETIYDTVARGEKVTITGFGSFERVERPERQARNPATGQTITVPATGVPKFKAGTEFKQATARHSARGEENS